MCTKIGNKGQEQPVDLIQSNRWFAGGVSSSVAQPLEQTMNEPVTRGKLFLSRSLETCCCFWLLPKDKHSVGLVTCHLNPGVVVKHSMNEARGSA